MKRAGATVSLLAAAAALGGCGQKGPLYLPDRPGSVVTRPVQTAPATPAAPTDKSAIDDPSTRDDKTAAKPVTPQTGQR